MDGITRIGIVGTGFISRGLFMLLQGQPDMAVSRVLTRSDIKKRTGFGDNSTLTNSIQELIEHSDIVVECSGDVIHATTVLEEVMKAKRPVVTMDADLQVTTGSYFSQKGFITEAEGDQPGCLAALREECLAMGFQPIVYGNIKGFLNTTPAPEEMRFWAKKQGISLDKTVSFTDGTKVQIEQALVANGLDATIIQPGLTGYPSEDVDSGGRILAKKAKEMGQPVSDYILSPKSPPGIFIVAEHDERFREYLQYYKLGDGPYYTLLRNYHLCNFEIIKTIRRVLQGGGVLLNNSTYPRISVAAIAKKPLSPGDAIPRGIGGFDVRGSTVRTAECPNHMPIGLLTNATVIRDIEPGQMLEFDDVEIPESRAREIWEGFV